MRIARNFSKHVFCLEGDWEQDLRDKSSITAALDFLHSNCGIKYIHKNCGTKENLKYYLSLWKQKRYRDYSICYLAFHGCFNFSPLPRAANQLDYSSAAAEVLAGADPEDSPAGASNAGRGLR